MHIRDRLVEAQLWSSTDGSDPEHDLAAAWQVSERLRDMGWTMVLTNRVNSRQHGEGAVITRSEYRVDLSHPHIVIKRLGNAVTGYGATAAQAICHAVLEALPYLGKDEGEGLQAKEEEV
jgi:hypothetical protein